MRGIIEMQAMIGHPCVEVSGEQKGQKRSGRVNEKTRKPWLVAVL